MRDAQNREWTRMSPTEFVCEDGAHMATAASNSDAYLISVINSMATEQTRQAAVDDAIAQDNVIANLKGMTNAQFDAWWSANVTTNAQAIGVLKRTARVVIRRVL